MAGSKSADLEIVIGASLDGLAADLRKGASYVKNFARDIDRVTPKGDEFRMRIDVKGLAKTARDAKEASGGFRSAAGELAGFGAKAAGVGIALMGLQGGFGAISAALDQVRESVSLASELEQTTLAFEVMLGSAERAKDMLAGLRHFAAETPFGSKETIDAARQLKAYGIAADQVIPTLKVLGDITSGLGGRTTLGEMAYLYGTLASQGRAFSKDIYQFTNRGVDLLPGLAAEFKVTKSEVMALVEEGRVGFPEVGRALERLRGAGGQFENLMERQSKTLGGLWEQAKDALEVGKIKFGNVLIEELGLKEAVKDFDGFVRKVEGGIDRIRPLVHFLGDVGRAVTHVGYEFATAGALSGNLFGKMAQEVPQLRDTFDSIQRVMDSAKEFKIDPADVAKLTVSIGKDVLLNAAVLVETVSELGRAFRDDILKPIKDTIGQIKPLVDMILAAKKLEKDGLKAVGDTLNSPFRLPAVDRVMDSVNKPNAGAKRQDALDRMDDFSKKLAKAADALDEVGNRLNKEFADKKQQDAWLHDPRHVPDTVAAQSARDWIARQEMARSFLDNRNAAFAGLNMGPVDPLGGLAIAVGGYHRDFESKLGSLVGVAGGLASAARLGNFEHGGLSFPNEPNSTVAALAKELREKYDPLAENNKLMSYRKNLESARDFKLITPEMFELGWQDAVRELGERVGVKHERLPDAALVGSQEDARILTNFFAGQTQASTEDLLKQIRDILAAKLGKIAEAPSPRPVQIAVPGGG